MPIRVKLKDTNATITFPDNTSEDVIKQQSEILYQKLLNEGKVKQGLFSAVGRYIGEKVGTQELEKAYTEATATPTPPKAPTSPTAIEDTALLESLGYTQKQPVTLEQPKLSPISLTKTAKELAGIGAEAVTYGTPLGRAAVFVPPLLAKAATGIASTPSAVTSIGEYIGEKLGESKLKKSYEEATGKKVSLSPTELDLTRADELRRKIEEAIGGVISSIPIIGRPISPVGETVSFGFEKMADVTNYLSTKALVKAGVNKDAAEPIGNAVGEVINFATLYLLGARKSISKGEKPPIKTTPETARYKAEIEAMPKVDAETLYRVVPEFKSFIDKYIKENNITLEKAFETFDVEATYTQLKDVLSKTSRDILSDPAYLEKVKSIKEEKDAFRKGVYQKDLNSAVVDNIITYLNSPEYIQKTVDIYSALARQKEEFFAKFPREKRVEYFDRMEKLRQAYEKKPKQIPKQDEFLVELKKAFSDVEEFLAERPIEKKTQHLDRVSKIQETYNKGQADFKKTVSDIKEVAKQADKEGVDIKRESAEAIGRIKEMEEKRLAGEEVKPVKSELTKPEPTIPKQVKPETTKPVSEPTKPPPAPELKPPPEPTKPELPSKPPTPETQLKPSPEPVPTIPTIPTTPTTPVPPKPQRISKTRVKEVEEQLKQEAKEPVSGKGKKPIKLLNKELKEQKDYILRRVEEELKTAEHSYDIIGEPEKVVIELPDGTVYKINKTIESLEKFKSGIKSKFPLSITPTKRAKPKQITPQATPRGRVEGEGVEYYNPFRPRERRSIEYGKNNVYFTKDKMLTNGHYAVKTSEPKESKRIAIERSESFADRTIITMDKLKDNLQDAKIIGEFKDSDSTSALAHIIGKDGGDVVARASYIDHILTEYPDAKVRIGINNKNEFPIVFESKGEIVGVVMPISYESPEIPFKAHLPRMRQFVLESIHPTLSEQPTLPKTEKPISFNTFTTALKYDTFTPEGVKTAVDAYRSYLSRFADTPTDLSDIDVIKFIKDNKGAVNVPEHVINKIKNLVSRQPKSNVDRVVDNVDNTTKLFAKVKFREQPEVVKYFSGIKGKIRQWCDTLNYIETIFSQSQPAINALRSIQEKRGMVMTQSLNVMKPYYDLPKDSRIKVNRYIKRRELEAEGKIRRPDPTLEELISEGFNTDEANAILAVRKFQNDIAPEYIKQALTTFYDESWFGEYKMPSTIEESKAISKDISKRIRELRMEIRWTDVEGKPKKEQMKILSPYLREIDRLKSIAKVNESVRSRVLKPVEKFKQDWYSPEERFGDYFVIARNPTAKSSDPPMFFNKVSSMKEAKQLAYTIAKNPEYKGTVIEYGKEYKSTLEELNRLSPSLVSTTQNVINDLIKRGYIKDNTDIAKLNEEITKIVASHGGGFPVHLMRSRHIPGYEMIDMTKAWASYTSSLANWYAHRVGGAEFRKALGQLNPRTEAPLITYLSRVYNYSRTRTPALAGLNRLMFIYYLGGNIKSAIINATQPVTITLPWSTKYIGESKALKLTASSYPKAMKYILNRDKGYSLEKLAEITGLDVESASNLEKMFAYEKVTPQAIRALTGYIEGKEGIGNKVSQILGFGFDKAETLNRVHAGIMGDKIAQIKGLKGEARTKFIEKFIDDTQFDYSKINRPAFAHNAAVAPLFIFRNFTYSWLNLMRRLLHEKEYKTFINMLVPTLVLGGIQSIPFVEVMLKTIESATDRDLNKEMREYLNNEYGETGGEIADMLSYGVSSTLLGVTVGRSISPFDVSVSPKQSFTEAVASQVGGVVGDIPARAQRVYKMMTRYGDTYRAVENMLPEFARNIAVALRWYHEQGARTPSGEVIAQTKISDIIKKSLGFQPTEYTKGYEIKQTLAETVGEVNEETAKVNLMIAKKLWEGDVNAIGNIIENVMAKNMEYMKKGQVHRIIIPDETAIKNHLFKILASDVNRIRTLPEKMRGYGIEVMEAYGRGLGSSVAQGEEEEE